MIALGVQGTATTGWSTALTTGAVSTTVGSTLVAWCAGSATFGTGTIADSKGNTWTRQIANIAFHGTYHHLSVWTCENANGGAGHTVTFTPQGGQSMIGELIEIQGAAASSFDQAAASVDTTAATITTAPINDLNATDFVLAIGVSSGSNVVSGVAAPFTLIVAINDGSNNVGGASAYRIVSSTGTYSATFTNTVSTDVAGATLSFKDAGGSPAPPSGTIATAQAEKTSATGQGSVGAALTWDSGQVTWDSGQYLWSDQYQYTGTVISGTAATGQGETAAATGASTLGGISGTIATRQAERVTGTASMGAAGLAAGAYDVTGGLPDAQDAAGLTLRAEYLGATLDRTLWLTKAKAGSPGAPGSAGDPGAPAINLVLTAPALLIFAYAEGTPTDPTFAQANGILTVMLGTTDVTGSCTLSASGTGCTGSVNTAVNTPLAGHPIGFYQITGMSADTALLTITVVYSGYTYHAVVSLAKARGGYEIVATLPVVNLFEGRVVYLTTDGKLYRYHSGAWTTAVPTLDLTGSIQDAQIAGLAASKITGQLTNAQLAAIDAAKVAGQLTSDQIASIDAAKVIGAVGTTTISDGAITTPKLAANAVTAGKIAANTITASEIAALTITAAQIAADTITGAKIAAGTVTASEIAALTITAAQIAAATITGAKIAAGTIQASNIVANSITANEIAANAITASEIAANTITGNKLAAGAIITASAQINDGVIISAKIGDLQVNSAKIADLTVGTTKIGANAVTRMAVAVLANDFSGNGTYSFMTLAFTPETTTSPVVFTWGCQLNNSYPQGNPFMGIRIFRVIAGVSTLMDFTGNDWNAGFAAQGGDWRTGGTFIDNTGGTSYRTYNMYSLVSDTGHVVEAGAYMMCQEFKK